MDDSFVVDQSRPDKAYMWLEERLQLRNENVRMLPKNCDCFLLQVGPTDLSEEEALDFYETLENPEEHGSLEEDWKGFDVSVLEFIQPYLRHVRIDYQVDEDDLVMSMKIRVETPNAIKDFELLQDSILLHTVPSDLKREEVVWILQNYITEMLEHPNYKAIAKSIRSARPLENVTCDESGTGKSTKQFYKFAKSILIADTRISLRDM